jgi:hypothetical protein
MFASVYLESASYSGFPRRVGAPSKKSVARPRNTYTSEARSGSAAARRMFAARAARNDAVSSSSSTRTTIGVPGSVMASA